MLVTTGDSARLRVVRSSRETDLPLRARRVCVCALGGELRMLCGLGGNFRTLSQHCRIVSFTTVFRVLEFARVYCRRVCRSVANEF